MARYRVNNLGQESYCRQCSSWPMPESGGTQDVLLEGVHFVASKQGTTPATFRIVRAGVTANALTVYYGIGGTAVNGTDYQTLSGSAVIPANSDNVVISVTPLNNTRGNQTVILTLTANAAYNMLAQQSATLTLIDNNATNLVTNPGFEEGNAAWTFNDSFCGQDYLPDDVLDGNLCLAMFTSDYGISQTVNVSANTYYQLSVWGKSSSITQGGYLYVQGYDNQGSEDQLTAPITGVTGASGSGGNGYQLSTIAFTTGANVTSVMIGANNGPGNGETWVDDFQLVHLTQCAAPTFTPAARIYTSAQTVSLSTTTNGATMRYTTDGSTPSETHGTIYTTALNIIATTTLQAIAYEAGDGDSAITSGVFNIQGVMPTPPTSGLVAWYSGLNIPSGTTTMTTWDDGTANQFTASGSASFASSVPALNNMPGVYFNGSQTMQTANMSSVFSASTGGMLFVLYAPYTIPGYGYAYITQNNAGSTATWDYFAQPNSPSGQGYLNAFLNSSACGGAGRTQDYPGTIPDGPALLEVESSSTAGYQAWVSGVAGTGTPPSAQYWQAPTIFTLGGGSSGANDFNGWVAEVLVYNSANDTERQQVEAYIQTLYGLGSINPCALPSFTPAPGSYNTAQNVVISSTSGATIRYTTDGSTPSETAGTVYSSPVNISATTTLQAIAYGNGMADSLVATGVYTITPFTNFFTASYNTGVSTSSGTFGYEFIPSQNIVVTALGRAVSGSMNQNHTIYLWQVSTQSLVASAIVTPASPTDALGYKYTTFGTPVNLTNGTTYRITSDESEGGDPFMFVGSISNHTALATVTQSVWGFASVYPTIANGDPDNGYVPPTFYIGSGGQCATPAFTAPPGTYGVAQSVTISCATGGATICYTTDGSTPTQSHGTVYSTPVNISSTTTLQAIAYAPDFPVSPVASGVYTITNGWAFTNFFTALYTGTYSATGTYGYEFTPTQNISVTALGRAVSGSMSQNHNIYIWQVSNQSLVVSTAVTPASPSDAYGYKYTTLGTPVPLTGGVTYRICSDERGGGDAFMSQANINAHLGVAAISQTVFGWSGSFPNILIGGANTGYGPPTFYVGNGGDCATPTFTAAPGTYGTAQSVTIACVTSGATICYTTDGSTPTQSHGTVYSSAVNISSATTLQAIAYETGFSVSPVASGVYTITNGWAFTNFFNALYSGTCSGTGTYGYEFTPTQNITVTALGRAVSGSMNNSHALYIWQVSNQSLLTSATVTPSSPSDALGYKYVLLGTAVNLTSGVNYIITSDETASGDAFMVQGNISNHSGVATIAQTLFGTTATYPCTPCGGTDTGYVPPTFYISGPCAAPTFSPAAGSYSSAQSVTISTTTGGATIRYTTNGTIPSSTVGTVYSSAVAISANTTLQAIAYESGYTNSTVASGVYAIQCAAPTFNPGAGTYTTSTSITISTTTGGASIRYTTNGTTPSSTVGTVYSSAVSLTSTSTLQAIAYETGLTNSAVASGVYTIQCAAPAFSPAAGTYTSATVTITSATSGASIRYTTNGTTPSSTVGTVYSSPVAISATETLQAIAYKTGLSNSAVTSGAYTIYIGSTSAGGTNTAITANEIRGTRFQAGSAMTINHINLDIGTSVSGNIQCAIYSDSSSKPNTLLKGTNALNNPGTGWQTFTLTSSQALTSGTYYWLLFWSAANYSVQNTTSSGSSWYRSLTYGSWPSSAGSGTTETRTWSVYGY